MIDKDRLWQAFRVNGTLTHIGLSSDDYEDWIPEGEYDGLFNYCKILFFNIELLILIFNSPNSIRIRLTSN